MRRRSIAALVEVRRGGYRGWEDDVKFRKPNYRLIAIVFVGAVIGCSACGFLPLFLITANNNAQASSSALTLVASATTEITPTPSVTLDSWSATGTAYFYASTTPTLTPSPTTTPSPTATPTTGAEATEIMDAFATITAAWMTITAMPPVVLTQPARVEQIVITQAPVVLTQPARVERVIITQPARVEQIIVTQPPIVIISTSIITQPPVVVTATPPPSVTTMPTETPSATTIPTETPSATMMLEPTIEITP